MRKPVTFFLLAGLIALFAAFFVRMALTRKEAQIQALNHATRQIIVAARDLSVGESTDASALTSEVWPAAHVPEGAESDPGLFIDRTVRTSFSKGQPIVASGLLERGHAGGLIPLMVPKGMRAVSIPVDEVADVSGFVLPYSRVDVLLSSSETHGNSPAVQRSKIIVQNASVLAVAQTVEAKGDAPEIAKIVTLLLTPEEAERVTNASQMGLLRLAIRNYGDQEIVRTSGSDVEDVWNANAPAPIIAGRQTPRFRPSLPQTALMEIIRDGHTREVVRFVNGARAADSADGLAPAPPAPAPPSQTVQPDASK